MESSEMPVADGMSATDSGLGETPVSTSDEVAQEKMLPQSQVDKIIGKVRSDVEQKAYARARKEYEAQQLEGHPEPAQLGGMKQPTQEQIDAMINQRVDQRVEERTQREFAERIIKDFTQKLEAGASKYEDFESVVSDLNLASNPHLVRWTNGLDNTADVLYDLGKNPEKYASVMNLAAFSPQAANKMLRSLSDSIKKNEEAKSTKSASEPLDHLKPSTNGMGDGSMTVSDLRKMDWLRG